MAPACRRDPCAALAAPHDHVRLGIGSCSGLATAGDQDDDRPTAFRGDCGSCPRSACTARRYVVTPRSGGLPLDADDIGGRQSVERAGGAALGALAESSPTATSDDDARHVARPCERHTTDALARVVADRSQKGCTPARLVPLLGRRSRAGVRCRFARAGRAMSVAVTAVHLLSTTSTTGPPSGGTPMTAILRGLIVPGPGCWCTSTP